MFLLVGSLALVACGDDGAAAGPDAAGELVDAGAEEVVVDASAKQDASPVEASTIAPAPVDPNIDHAAPFFDPNRLLEVRITLADSDWELIRSQERSLFDIFGGDDCQADPFGSPFTFVPADVSVDGVEVPNAGVRKKGFFGSLSYDKPSLKIDFGEYVPGQTLEGMRRMTLNNNKQDESHLNQCLGYAFFRDAGVPAPRCNFARVLVNNVDLGVYTHVESVKKPFLRQHFDDDGGNLYEGTLSDFRSGWQGTFEQKTNQVSDPSRADLQAVIDAAVAPGDAVAALEAVVDVERFISFWAVESLVGHGDGYSANTNNFYVYADPTDGRFVFMPWGADQLFDNGEDRTGEALPAAVTQGMVANVLYSDAAGRARYLERMESLLDEFRAADRLDEIARMRALIEPHIPPAQRAGFADGVANLEAFIVAREQQVRTQLSAGLPPEAATLRDSMCFQARGRVEATFDTVWNSLDNPAVNPTDFSATFTPTGVDFPYAPNPLGLMTALAGIDQNADSPDFEAVILLVMQQLDGSSLLLVVQIAPANLGPGMFALDFNITRGLIVQQQGDQEGTLLGLLGEGTLTLDQAATTDGAPVVGSLSATVYDPGFLVGG
ncbi:MAG: CotH kinase family protein [Myxococcales bacterium]|nr:CotH kinase family protein [Myxococcales bacterium]